MLRVIRFILIYAINGRFLLFSLSLSTSFTFVWFVLWHMHTHTHIHTTRIRINGLKQNIQYINRLQTPRYYNVSDATRPRTAEQNYSYSYASKSESTRDSNNPYGRPERSAYSSTTERKSATGPGGYNYTTERSSTSGNGPSGYSYTSTARWFF